jgi:hypothetical protein
VPAPTLAHRTSLGTLGRADKVELRRYRYLATCVRSRTLGLIAACLEARQDKEVHQVLAGISQLLALPPA